MKKFQKLFSKYRFRIYFLLAGLIVGAGLIYGLFYGGILSLNNESMNSNLCPDSSKVSQDKPKTKHLVDIRGAVKNPGVYSFDEGSIVNDLLTMAGGLKSDADTSWIDQNINYARVVEDREKIYLPFKASVSISSSVPLNVSSVGISKKINLNTSTKSELESLPGVGPATADKIIQGRPYKTIKDILNVKGIGESLFEKMKDLIVV